MNRFNGLKLWVLCTRPIAFGVTVGYLYVLFDLLPSYLFIWWYPTEASVINTQIYHLFFFTVGIRFAFYLSVSIYIALSAKSMIDKLWGDFMPPHQKRSNTSKLPIPAEKVNYSLYRSIRISVIGICFMIVAFPVLMYLHLEYLHFQSDFPKNYLELIPDSAFLPVLYHILEAPLEIFIGESLYELNTFELQYNLIYFWIPSVPLTVIIANMYNAIYKLSRELMYQTGLRVLNRL